MKTKEAYAAYLMTDHWWELRRRVIERDGGRCTRCQSRERLQAHHLRYRYRWEDARLSDLVTLCRACHEKEHGIQPERALDYVSQIFTMDQLIRARSLDFITQPQFDQLRRKFEPPKPAVPSNPSRKQKDKQLQRDQRSFRDKWKNLQRQLQSEQDWRKARGWNT